MKGQSGHKRLLVPGGNPLKTSYSYTSAPRLRTGLRCDPGWNMTNRSVSGLARAYLVNDLNQAITNIETGAIMSYDSNGNLSQATLNGVYNLSHAYTYDEENRLVRIVCNFAGVPTTSWWRTDPTYDGLSRMRVREHYSALKACKKKCESKSPSALQWILGSK